VTLLVSREDKSKQVKFKHNPNILLIFVTDEELNKEKSIFIIL
jgi:hypothetical protein